MGQLIEVEATTMGDAAVFHADRSISGQDGEAFDREGASHSGNYPAQLAGAIFDSDADVDHVYVGSNGVVVRRPPGWDEGALGAVAGVIERFFVHYEES